MRPYAHLPNLACNCCKKKCAAVEAIETQVPGTVSFQQFEINSRKKCAAVEAIETIINLMHPLSFFERKKKCAAIEAIETFWGPLGTTRFATS